MTLSSCGAATLLQTYDLQRAWFWSHLGHASNLNSFFKPCRRIKNHLSFSLDCYGPLLAIPKENWPLLQFFANWYLQGINYNFQLESCKGLWLFHSLDNSAPFFATTASQLWPNIFSEKKKIEIFIPAAGQQEWLPFLSSFQLLFFRCCQIAWWVLYKF